VSVLRKYSVLQRPRAIASEHSLVKTWHQNTRQLSVSALKFSEVKEELVFEVPAKPSTEASVSEVFTIPDKPTPVSEVSSLGEPSLDSLGLCSWWPSGRMQYLLELMHIDLGLEWYQSIAVVTLCMRLLMVPVVVMAQRNMAHMNNNMPAMTALQEKISDARRRGDLFEMAQLTQELQGLTKKRGINPFKNAIPLVLQMPVFMSFFFGLRGMTNCPVESMSSGGLFWFENLTMADPFYILPLMTCCSTYLQLKVGADGARLDQMTPKMKIAMKIMPFFLFPITMNFASAVTFYWFTTNVISLGQARFFKVQAVRTFFKIPDMIKHKKIEPPKTKKKGFRESVKDSIDNFRVTSQIVDRRAYDEKMFKEAGQKKPVKTYKFDPTKVNNR